MRHKTTVQATVATEAQSDRISELIKSWFANPELWYSVEQHHFLKRLFDINFELDNYEGLIAPTDETPIQLIRGENGLVNCLQASSFYVLTNGMLKTVKIATVHNFIEVALSEINQTLFKNTNTVGIQNLSNRHRLLLNNYILFYMVGMRPSESL